MEDRITLGGLAFACHAYQSFGGEFDGGYDDLVTKTKPRLNLHDTQHLRWMLEWLNNWGCRQFKKTDHGLAIRQISDWFSKYETKLPAEGSELFLLKEPDLVNLSIVFDDLANRIACTRTTKRPLQSEVRVGPVGTAKILFAMRPKTFLPWDNAIMGHFGLDGSGRSYGRFLHLVKGWLTAIGEECIRNGFSLNDLPSRVGRAHSSPAKLIDEYLWATVTYRLEIPSREILREWANWS